jgi:hypothetical protein
MCADVITKRTCAIAIYYYSLTISRLHRGHKIIYFLHMIMHAHN